RGAVLSRWSVSPARASEPAVRVAAQRALHQPRSVGARGGSLRAAGPWWGDLGAPVAVANDPDRTGVEHLHRTLRRPPPWQVAAAQLLPAYGRGLCAEPAE